jgi:subtilisin family serine protease
MRGRLATCVALAATSLVPLVSAHGATTMRGVVADSPVVALLDSGVRVTHDEFAYAGPRATNDQIAAWWDFTTDKKATAVLPKTPSGAPGYRLAIGKVSGNAGAIQHLSDAIRWAVHTVRASVISISLGTVVPDAAALYADDLDAIDDAWRSGVLVVVANGNGWGNVGVLPGEPGWAVAYGMSNHVLAVGGSDLQGVLETTDPEVTALSAVQTATNTADGAYILESGTSFAAPFVAGLAARAIAAGRAAHRDVSPARIRQLLEYSAVDGPRPPQSEGYGSLSLAELPSVLRYARAGGLPARPNPDVSGTYVENVAMPLRDLWGTTLRRP